MILLDSFLAELVPIPLLSPFGVCVSLKHLLYVPVKEYLNGSDLSHAYTLVVVFLQCKTNEQL